MGSQWRAGFASRDITPPIGAEMSGYVIRRRPAATVHDPLFARALALDDGDARCCLVLLDLIGVDLELTRTIRRAIARNASVPEAHVAIAATHTHGGPAILPGTHLGRVDPDYRAHVVWASTAAAASAIASMKGATLRFGLGHEGTIARNRRDLSGPVDHDVPVLRIDRGDAIAAIVVGYACHPVTLGPDNLHITRDYPGALVTELERRYPNAFVAFATGCCGQVSTGHRAEDSLRSGSPPGRSFDEARRIGDRLAVAAANAVEDAAAGPPLRGPLRVSGSVVDLPLAPPPEGTRADVAGWSGELAEVVGRDAARQAMLETLIAWGQALDERMASSVEVEAMCIGLGNACIALYPGEVFVEFGLELKAALPRHRVVTIACASAAPGYLPHRSAYAAGGYEVTEAYRFYGRPGPFPPEAGETLQDVMLRLAREVLP